MNKFCIELPTLYGDHHVSEVRRLLQMLPGVEEIYASSCFHLVELQYDPVKVSEAEIVARLKEAGYLGELPAARETGTPAYEELQATGKSAFFRHTAVYETTRQVISFAQKVDGSVERERGLWPCPGMGAVTMTAADEGED